MITLHAADYFRLELRTRMPFRYGIATLTEVPQIILRLTFDLDGARACGVASDMLPPKWFTKDPQRDVREEIDEMLRVILAAVRHARDVRAATPFAFWRELYAAQAAWGAAEKLPPLLVHFGTSFVERALIHAAARARGVSFAAGLRDNAFGIELGAIHAALAGSAPRDWLPAAPPATVFARHTVGLSDPLGPADLAVGERIDDGLPQTLVECVRFYGLRHFKIKINGEAARDRDRLEKMATIFAAECGGDYAFSLDGNESFHDVPSFADYFRSLASATATREFWSHLLYVEQPWHRNVALSSAIAELGRAWPDRPPVIIDESDGEIESLPTALALGYAGTSHKNCKGVFKGIANACLLAQRRAAGRRAVLSGEDLANVGPVALTQDLAAQAALGVTSVERNGHHYFAGLAQYPRALQDYAATRHPDLYVRAEGGASATGLGGRWPRVDIRRGEIAMGSVNAAPFGVVGDLDLAEIEVARLD